MLVLLTEANGCPSLVNLDYVPCVTLEMVAGKPTGISVVTFGDGTALRVLEGPETILAIVIEAVEGTPDTPEPGESVEISRAWPPED